MYTKFFGFTEKPFKLVPDPTFLFLSKGHEEALAYLTYAIGQEVGFVAISGEVGMGKTTLCRAFIESFDDSIEFAYIFNPHLEAIELLKAINEEFGLSAAGDTTKELIDALNTFLLEKKSAGQHTILIIDEAHNLTFDVLEQIRLLSNLETTRHKLLQIILVGQPELDKMLESPRLRQLKQRIALRYHIHPLTLKETRQYIEYRLRVASKKPTAEFSAAAFARIQKYSGGIPRMINIVCDRALLTAFCVEKKSIGRDIIRQVERELSPGPHGSTSLSTHAKVGLGVIALAVVALVVAGFWRFYPPEQASVAATAPPVESRAAPPEPPPLTETANPAGVDSNVAAVKTPMAEPQAQPSIEDLYEAVDRSLDLAFTPAEFGAFLDSLDPQASRQTALLAMLELWQMDLPSPSTENETADDLAFFTSTLRKNGLELYTIQDDLPLIKRLDLPLILALDHPESDTVLYLTAGHLDDNEIVFSGYDVPIQVRISALDDSWNGTAHVVWKNFLDIKGIISNDHRTSQVATLKMLLRNAGFEDLTVNQSFDRQTLAAVRTLQAKNGLKADGVVGAATKIVLYNSMQMFETPRLTPKNAASAIEPATR